MFNIKFAFDTFAFGTLISCARELDKLIPGNIPSKKVSAVFVKSEFFLLASMVSSFLYECGEKDPPRKRTYQYLNLALLGCAAFINLYAPVPEYMFPTRESTADRITTFAVVYGLVHLIPNR